MLLVAIVSVRRNFKLIAWSSTRQSPEGLLSFVSQRGIFLSLISLVVAVRHERPQKIRSLSNRLRMASSIEPDSSGGSSRNGSNGLDRHHILLEVKETSPEWSP